MTELLRFVQAIHEAKEPVWAPPVFMEKLLGNMDIEFFCRLYDVTSNKILITPARPGFVVTEAGGVTTGIRPAKYVYSFVPTRKLTQDTPDIFL